MLDQSSKFLFGGNFSTGLNYFRPGTNYSDEFLAGGLLFQFDAVGGPPGFESENIPFGYFHQGSQVYGRLRDKDVFHLSAKGSVVVSDVMAASPVYPISTGIFAAWGRNVLLSGYRRPVATVVPWGVGTFHAAHSILVPATQNVAGTFAYGEHTVTAAYDVEFDGDYALVKFEYRMSELVSRSGTVVTTSAPKVKFRALHWLKINRLQTTWGVCRYIGSVSNATGKWLVSTPSGNIDWDQVSADPRKYKIDVTTNVTLSTYVGSVGGSSSVAEVVKSSIRSQDLLRYVTRVFAASPHTADWGLLGEDLIKQYDYVDANILLTAFDLLRLRTDMQSWRNLGKMFKDLSGKSALLKTLMSAKMKNERFFELVGRNVKSWTKLTGKAYLGVDYGVLPTVRDTQALYEGMHAFAKHVEQPLRRHSRRTSSEPGFLDSSITSTDVLTVETSPLPRDFLGMCLRGWMDEIEWFRRWGVYPDCEMLYDIVPFSFAVDWFVGFGSALEDVDTNLRSQYIDVNYCIQSTRRVWSPAITRIWPYLGVSGGVDFTQYDRYMTRELPTPEVQVGEGSGVDSHAAEATALIVTRKFF